MDKDVVWYIYVYDEILLSHGKEWNFAIDGNMDGFGRHYAKWNKSDKRRIVYDIIYMWNLKKCIQLENKTKK